MRYNYHISRQPSANNAPVPDWSLWRQWIMANAIGELVGLGGAAALGAAVISTLGDTESTTGTITVAVVMILAGVFEGIIVGFAQWMVLTHRLPHLTEQRWVVATAAGSFIAWVLGMIPSTIMSLQSNTTSSSPSPEISDAVVYLLAAAMGLVLGPILAFAQWLVLRRHVRGAGLWIAANAVAWAFAMPVIFIGAGAVGERGISVGTITLALCSIILAGAIVGAVHGLALLRLIERRIDSSEQNERYAVQSL